MKKETRELHLFSVLFVVMSLFFLTSCIQESDIKSGSSAANEEGSVLKANLITSHSVDRAYVGMDLKELLRNYSDCQVKDTPGYYFGLDGNDKCPLIIKNNKPLMVVWTNSDKKVAGLFSLSENIHTDNNLRKGMTIREIKEIYPKSEIELDDMAGNMEYFYVPDKKIKLCFMTWQKHIGIYSDSTAVHSSSKEIKNDTARVQFIEVSE